MAILVLIAGQQTRALPPIVLVIRVTFHDQLVLPEALRRAQKVVLLPDLLALLEVFLEVLVAVPVI
jgi:hypothetical protein